MTTRKKLTTADARKGVEARAAISASINFRSRSVKRRRNTDEVPDKGTAIVSMCRECMGYEPGEGEGSLANVVRQCTARECWLWPWRTGTLDPSLVARDD